MLDIIYEYIDYKNTNFNEIVDLRYNILFKPYGKIKKYEYDEQDKYSYHLVALIDNKVIGYSRLSLIDSIILTGKISNVVVHPKYNKNGIGHNMLKIHIKKAHEINIKYLFLHARKDTVDFYRKVGFISKGPVFTSKMSGLPLQKMYLELK